MLGALLTASLLLRERPTFVWYQFSFVLGVLLACYFRLVGSRRMRLVADLHTKALRRSGWGAFRPLILGMKGWALRACTAALVTNEENAVWARQVFGIDPYVLPDPLPSVPGSTPGDVLPDADVVFVSSFAVDEPVTVIASAAASLVPGVSAVATGDPTRLRRHDRSLLARHVRLTGYLSDGAYWKLLRAAGCIVVLSTEPACLPCGAYEAIAVGKRPIVVDDPVTRRVFGDSAVYSSLEPDALARTIRAALESRGSSDVARSYQERWHGWWSALPGDIRMDLTASPASSYV